MIVLSNATKKVVEIRMNNNKYGKERLSGLKRGLIFINLAKQKVGDSNELIKK